MPVAPERFHGLRREGRTTGALVRRHDQLLGRPTADAAEFALEEFEEKGEEVPGDHPALAQCLERVVPFLDYDVEIRRVICRLDGSADPSAAQANPGRRPAARPLLVALASGFGRRAAQAVDDPAEQEGQEAHG